MQRIVQSEFKYLDQPRSDCTTTRSNTVRPTSSQGHGNRPDDGRQWRHNSDRRSDAGRPEQWARVIDCRLRSMSFLSKHDRQKLRALGRGSRGDKVLEDTYFDRHDYGASNPTER